jgi:hypothetical protein
MVSLPVSWATSSVAPAATMIANFSSLILRSDWGEPLRDRYMYRTAHEPVCPRVRDGAADFSDACSRAT